MELGKTIRISFPQTKQNKTKQNKTKQNKTKQNKKTKKKTKKNDFLLVKICEIVPEGLLIFFPSYQTLDSCLKIWQNVLPLSF